MQLRRELVRMVEAYTIDGKITLNTEPFDKAIGDITSKMETLMELGGGNWNFNGALTGLHSVHTQIDTLKSDIESMSNSFSDVKGINALKSEIQSLRTEMDSLKAKINEIGTTAREQATQVGSAVSSTVQKVKNEILTMSTEMSQLRFDRNFMSNATLQGFTQIVQKNRENGQLIRENTGWLKEQRQVHEADLSIYSDIIARLEQEGARRHELLGMIAEEIELLHRVNQINRQGNRDIVSRYEAEGRIYTSIAEQIGIASERNAIEERELMFLDEQLALRTEILALTREGTAESVKKAETLVKELQGDEKIITAIQEEIAMTKELLSLEESRVGVANATAQAKTKSAVSGTGSSVNQLDKMGNLPRRIGSMALTMWGFNEIMDIYEKASSNLNARGSQKYFSEALQKDQRYLNQTKQSSVEVGVAMSKLGNQLDALQKKYQKIDMSVVGANAEETAYKYGLQADKIADLSEVMAIYGSEFVKQGRSQEDSILALNDALDGELRRLKEVNVGKEELEAHGWKGDQATMIDALKEIADERGYTLTAQNITNLNDAIETLELKISRDLVDAFEYFQPILMEVAKDFVIILEAIEGLVGYLSGVWKSFSTRLDIMFGVQNMQKFGDIFVKVVGGIITGLIGLYIIRKVANVFKSGWNTILETLGRTKTIDKASESLEKLGGATNTGGTSAPKKKGSFGDGIKGLAENLGKMAKVFIEVAVALAMAFFLLEEALVLISGIGATYDALKPQFDSGIKFIQEFGIWIWGASAVLIAFMGYIGKFEGLDTSMIDGAKTMAKGMALAMGLIAEAILLLIAPLGAIALLGAFQGWQQGNIEKGMAVIHMFADALNYIANNQDIATFLLAFSVISVVLGVSEGILAEPLVVGVATAIGLVAVAIGMLIAPLSAIALLGVTYSTVGVDNVQKGAEAINLVAKCLIALEPAVRNLLAVDVEMFGVALVDFATRLATGGKDGITALSEDIIPKFVTFAKKLNEMDMPTEIDSGKITALTTIANQIPPLYRALQSVNTALATSDAVGNMGGAIGGSISNAIGMGLQGKLDQIYNDSKAIMDWATKMSSLNGSNGTGGASAVTQVAQVIVDLKTKLAQMSATISSSANSIQTSATQLGRSIITGWKSGSASFGATVVQTVANGVKAVQNRYNTMANGGRTLGNKLTQGFNSHSPKLITIVSNEIQYALREIDANEQNFYNRGAKLGRALSDGFESEKGMNVGSPARIARAIAQEMIYSKNAIDMGAIMMYRGGQALGSALANGYADSQLKTNIGMLTQTGVSNEEITNAQTRKPPIQSQQGQGNPMIININMNGANIFGVKDLENTMRNIADKVFIEYNDINPNIGG